MSEQQKQMKRYEASKVMEGKIELAGADKLNELYQTIQNEDNFILEWKEGNVKKSKVVIGNNVATKLKNGDLELTAQEGPK